MLTIRINEEVENKLILFAKELNKTKSELVKEAINEYLSKLENKKIQAQKEALNYFLNNPIQTGIKDLKAIQKVKSEKDFS